MKILLVIRKDCKYSQKAYQFIKKFNYQVDVLYSSHRNQAIPSKLRNWKGDYLFSLFNYYIFPKSMIKNIDFLINFHPSTPDHPGSGMANWSLYYNDKYFGSTAHLINEKIDNGKILRVKRFEIKENDSIESLIKKNKKNCLTLFFEIVDQLLNKKVSIEKMIKNSSNEKWLCKARKIKEIDDISKINLDITSIELERRIKAFHTSKNPLSLYLHGNRFILDKS